MIEWPANFLQKLLTITLEDWIYLVFSGVVVLFAVGFVLVSNPQADAQYRFVLREGLDAFGDNESADLAFAQEDISIVNQISANSVGHDSVGDERLFCFREKDGVVTELRFADNISESSEDAVSGSCTTTYSAEGFDGWMHTHPGYSDELSEEDEDLESPESTQFTCIVFDEVVEINGEVGGLKCWKVTDSEDSEYGFEEIEVGLTSRPDLVSP